MKDEAETKMKEEQKMLKAAERFGFWAWWALAGLGFCGRNCMIAK